MEQSFLGAAGIGFHYQSDNDAERAAADFIDQMKTRHETLRSTMMGLCGGS